MMTPCLSSRRSTRRFVRLITFIKRDRSRSRANYTWTGLSASLISTDIGHRVVVYPADNVFTVFIIVPPQTTRSSWPRDNTYHRKEHQMRANWTGSRAREREREREREKKERERGYTREDLTSYLRHAAPFTRGPFTSEGIKKGSADCLDFSFTSDR